MSLTSEEEKCKLSARLPTAEETLSLHQRSINLIDAKYDALNQICPYLVGRVVIEPWTDFDEQVRQTALIAKEMLVKDDSALQRVQCALGRAWTAVDRASLVNSYDVACLFPDVFEVLRSMVQIVDEKTPPLSCAMRVILPPHGVRKPQALPVKNCVMIDAKDWDARTPCLCVTSAWPSICLYSGTKNVGPLPPRCAQAISERWNAVLSKQVDPADLANSQHQLWILQAVTDAMYAHSGCGVLWNYRSVVAVRVAGFATGTNGGRGKVRVQVSSMYTDGQAENAMFGLVSAVQVALKRALSSNRSESLRLCREILCKSTHCFVCTDKTLFSEGPSKWLSDSLNVDIGPDENTEEYCWISRRATALFKSEFGGPIDNASLAPEFFEHVLSRYSRVMFASEETSVLLVGSLGNVTVVTKYANANLFDGSEMMRTEADIYNRMRTGHVELLGSCVPDVLAICMKPRCDPVVVVEYVGQSVTRDRDRKVMVGGTAVSELDWMQIVSAANRGLDSLARAGLSHCDESIGNIRAERVVQNAPGEQGGQDKNEAWHVWWIDFGLAEVGSGTRKIKDKWYDADVSIHGQSTYFNDL